MGSKSLLNPLLTDYQKAEEKKTAEIKWTAKLDFEMKENKASTAAIILSNNFFLKKDNTNNDDNWLDKEND